MQVTLYNGVVMSASILCQKVLQYLANDRVESGCRCDLVTVLKWIKYREVQQPIQLQVLPRWRSRLLLACVFLGK